MRPAGGSRAVIRALAAAIALALPGAGTGQAQDDSVASAPAAVLRALDKISGATTDFEILRGQTVVYGRLRITLGDCRYPADNPASDAWAWLEIRDPTLAEPAFSGWMVASSPALNALDHPRYDVWVLRCSNS
jgi:hypothetical protein